ncbi:hypothetical protein PanWU01x14_357940 [Parasponia andersonii]|uniref:Uncharacterized protein n=1 Tax=Parasponia andersonii TaxID=3476 RepID=A0A2P5A8G0_PARAD|nr:hypothetical protein PanWU01x14_357940 [Parasponia andersonii]
MHLHVRLGFVQFCSLFLGFDQSWFLVLGLNPEDSQNKNSRFHKRAYISSPIEHKSIRCMKLKDECLNSEENKKTELTQKFTLTLLSIQMLSSFIPRDGK